MTRLTPALRRPVELLRKAAFLLRSLEFREIAGRVLSRTRGSSEAHGLRRDLGNPVEDVDPDIPLTIRPARARDGVRLFALSARGMTKHERHEYLDRLLLLDAGIETCYVVETTDGTPVYIQWVIGAEENERMRELFNDWFPPLAPDEVLLEYALTAKEYRGHHVMSWALTNILRMEQARGKRWAVTFIPSGNEISLHGHVKLGFKPFTVRRERRFLFTRTLTFTPTG